MSFFFSLQCGRQIAQLKDEYEESKKNLEEEASRLRQVSILYVLHFLELVSRAPCPYLYDLLNC